MANIEIITYEKAEGRLKEIYQELIARRGKLADIHTVQSLHPESIMAHMDLYMTIMFSRSPLSREQRELMAVIVSIENGCVYCQQHHSAALGNYWNNPERIKRLLTDPSSAGLSEKDLILCAYAKLLTCDPAGFGSGSHLQNAILRGAGFDDRSILDATMVIAYFNFVNRIVLALDVQPEADAGQGYKY